MSPGLKPGEYMAALAATAARYPRGSVGMFLGAAFWAGAKCWRDTPVLRPADFVTAADAVEEEFSLLDAGSHLEYGLGALPGVVAEGMSKLEIYTLSQVCATAMVCAQEATIEWADANHGVGDAGLASACLILASLSDVAAELEGEAPTNTAMVQTMLDEWANRSRPVTKALRSSPPGGEFEVTFFKQSFGGETAAQSGALSATCSEVLLLEHRDEIGFSSLTTRVHTPVPLSVIPHPHDAGVLIRHLAPRPLARVREDPLPQRDNVVLLSRSSGRPTPEIPVQIVVLSRAPALVESFARTGATVLLDPTGVEEVLWALPAESPIVLVASTPESRELAERAVQLGMLPSEDTPEFWPQRRILVAPTKDELSATWLVEALSRLNLREDDASWKDDLRDCFSATLGSIRVEPLESDLFAQLDSLLSFSGEDQMELFAVIAQGQSGADRVSLQSGIALNQNVELTAYYGGQPGPTLLGVRK